jgi:hypothetical protein
LGYTAFLDTKQLGTSKAKDEGGRTLLYQTLQQLVKFHASMQALGGESCTQVLMKDFDTHLSGNGAESAGPKEGIWKWRGNLIG